MTFFSLETAALCVDCDAIGNSLTSCPRCASGSVMALAGVLNRRPHTVHDEVMAVMRVYRDSVSSKMGA
jgi:hypothetical protein